MQPGACSATASANRRPGSSSQLPGKVCDEGRVQRSPVHRHGEPCAAQCDGLGGGLGVQVPRRELWPPPPDGHHGDIDGAARHGGEPGHLRKQPRVTRDPDDARRAADELAVGVVGPVRHGAVTMLRRHLPNFDAAACRRPAIPQRDRVQKLCGGATRRRSPEHSSGPPRAACGGIAARRGRGAGGRGARRRARSTTPGPAGVPGAAAARRGDEAADRSGSGRRRDRGPQWSGQAR